ncbi:MAG: Hsp20/alpha crystallin family protein, partial [Anderseniella sp.]|nr:Hsp20/alpha crystallin family protein [Anderseniella sp.]
GVLTIKGKKNSEHEEEGENFYISERSFGSFSRAFRLPDGVDEEAVAASFDKGVLTVTLPKMSKTKTDARRVPVEKK